MYFKTPILLAIASLWLLSGCKEDKPTYHLTLTPHYHVDGEELVLDTIIYQNAAGNPYSVNRLRYYLSDFRCIKANGTEIRIDDGAYFMDARVGSTIQLNEVPPGSYEQFSFTFGIPTAQNIYGNLPNDADNVGMVWPEQMGGGYHFMKFEGYFNSSSGINGFAIHVGNNACAAIITISTPFEITEDGNMTLGLNLNEILTGPNTFDMDSSNYTMGIMPAMLKISENMHNVFTIEKAP